MQPTFVGWSPLSIWFVGVARKSSLAFLLPAQLLEDLAVFPDSRPASSPAQLAVHEPAHPQRPRAVQGSRSTRQRKKWKRPEQDFRQLAGCQIARKQQQTITIVISVVSACCPSFSRRDRPDFIFFTLGKVHQECTSKPDPPDSHHTAQQRRADGSTAQAAALDQTPARPRSSFQQSTFRKGAAALAHVCSRGCASSNCTGSARQPHLGRPARRACRT